MSMETTQRILCGTDFTPAAKEAAEVASAFSLATGEPLLLVHALEPMERDVAEEQLKTEAERLRKLFPELKVETKLETGNADEVLVDLARRPVSNGSPEKSGVSLIVLSALGQRAPARWVLGSVSERTVEASPVPVLLVRNKEPFLAWLRGERRFKIVFGFDFSPASSLALQWANDLARLGPCEVLIGHVAWPPPERKRRGPSGTAAADQRLPRLETELRNELSRRLRGNPWKDVLPSLRIKLSPGRRGVALAELASEEKADLLVVGSRQVHGPARLWQESVSRSVLYHASTNVACVPMREFPDASTVLSAAPPTDEDEIELVRKLEAQPFLRGLSGEVLRRMAAMTEEMIFAKGEILFREGGEADRLFLLVSGLVELELHVPGQGAVRLETLRAGDILGLSWLLPPYRWQLDARAVEPSSVLAIDARRLREWMEEEPAVGQVLAMRLVGQLYERLERARMQRLDLYRIEA